MKITTGFAPSRFVLIIGILLLLMTGCKSPLSQVPQGDTDLSGMTESRISVTVPALAPWLAEAFKREGGSAGTAELDSTAASRAFCVADTVDLIVRDSGGVEVGRRRFSHVMDGDSSFTGSIDVPAGSGYSVQVDIYNARVSVDEPVVSGSVTAVEVQQGQTSSVAITCLPVAATVITLETDSPFSLVPFVLDGNGRPVSNGGESWFRFTSPASGYIRIIPTLPISTRYAIGLFNDSGVALETTIYSTATQAGPISVGGLVPDEEHYLVFICAAPDAAPRNLSLRIEEMTVNYLTDTDVPDPELRTLLEFYTGKQFATAADPDPVNPVTNLDLAAITAEIRTDGYNGGPVITGIINLTGLEYCDGTRFLLLNGNDLSGVDAHLEVLSGMTNLETVDAVYCSIAEAQHLASLHNLVQLKIWGNPELDLAELLLLDATALPKLKRLGFGPWDSTGDGVVDPVSEANFSQLVTMLAGHTKLVELYITNGPAINTDAMFQELYDDVLALDPDRWQILDFFGCSFSGTVAAELANLTSIKALMLGGNPSLTDISWISGMTSLGNINLNSSAITTILPLKDLYDAGGLRTGASLWWGFDVDLSNCTDLVLSEGSPDGIALQYLIDRYIRVEHDETWVSEPPAWETAFANPEGAYIHGIAWDGTAIRMVSRTASEILRVDPVTGSVLDRIPAPVSGGGTGLAWDGSSLWYTHDTGGGSPLRIYKLSPSDGTVLSSFDAPYQGDSTGLAWDGTHLWNTGFGGALYRLLPDGTQVSSIPAPNSIAEGLDYDLARGVLLHIDYNGVFYEIDPASGNILFSVDAPGTRAYGVTFDGNNIWVSSNDGKIYRLDITP